MPNFASDGSPRILSTEVTIIIAMPIMVMVPSAVDTCFFRPERV